MKKITLFILFILTTILSGCGPQQDVFSYEVKYFNVYTNIYDDVIHHEFINLQGLTIIDTYDAYLESTYETNFIEHTLTYDEAFFETHTLVLVTIYDEKADKFDVVVTRNHHDYDVIIQQTNGINRFSPAIYDNIWTIGIEIESKDINDVQYKIIIDNSYYQFYSYWLKGSHNELTGAHVFEDYTQWEAYINQILFINKLNVQELEYLKRHNLISLRDIVDSNTFTDKIVVVYFADSYESPESYYLPLDVYQLQPIDSSNHKLYFNMFMQWGSPGMGLDTLGHSMSIFILDKQDRPFEPVFILNNQYFVR